MYQQPQAYGGQQYQQPQAYGGQQYQQSQTYGSQQYQQPQTYGGQQYQQSQPQNQRQYNQRQQQRENLQPVCNMGFAFNHLLTVGLTHRIPSQDSQSRDYKEKHFFFVTVAPGVGDGANRTYSFDNNVKISMKFSMREISALAFVLMSCAQGNDSVLPYTKFSRQGHTTKNLSIWTSYKTQNINQQQVQVKMINITTSADQNRHTLSLNSSDAYSIGQVLDMMFKRGMELEMEYQYSNPQPNQFANQQSFPQSPGPNQFGFPQT